MDRKKKSALRTLADEALGAVSGGRFKRPLQPPITVYYDDGVTIWTSDPSTSNVRPLVT